MQIECIGNVFEKHLRLKQRDSVTYTLWGQPPPLFDISLAKILSSFPAFQKPLLQSIYVKIFELENWVLIVKGASRKPKK